MNETFINQLQHENDPFWAVYLWSWLVVMKRSLHVLWSHRLHRIVSMGFYSGGLVPLSHYQIEKRIKDASPEEGEYFYLSDWSFGLANEKSASQWAMAGCRCPLPKSIVTRKIILFNNINDFKLSSEQPNPRPANRSITNPFVPTIAYACSYAPWQS